MKEIKKSGRPRIAKDLRKVKVQVLVSPSFALRVNRMASDFGLSVSSFYSLVLSAAVEDRPLLLRWVTERLRGYEGLVKELSA